MTTHNTSLRYYYELFWVLVQKEFKIRYKASILGYFWSVFSPLAQGCIFFVAFGIFMRFPQENYLLFLLSALYPWQWISNALSHAPKIFLISPALVKKIAFPRFLMPAACAFQYMIHFLCSLPVFFLFSFLYGIFPTPICLLYIVIMLVVSYVMVASLGVIFSCINIYVRDMENIIPMLLQMLFFLTPVIYPLEVIPENFRLLLHANPFFALVSSWRSILLHHAMPWGMALEAAGIAGVAAWGARRLYARLSWKLAELL